MIDKEQFAQGMGLLGGTFRHDVDEPVIHAYYAVLSPRLTDEEWGRAVAITIASERFWPSPAVLLEKVGRDDETVSQLAWRHLTETLGNHGGYRFMPHEKYLELDDATKAGVKAIGGLREISECSETRWPGLVKRFCKAYLEALKPRPALSSGATVDPEVRRLVAQVGRDMALPPSDR